MPLFSYSLPLHTALFPATWAAGCESWKTELEALSAAYKQSLPVEIREFPAPGKTPDGQPLFTQSTWLGPADAPAVVVLIAGTHGIEGYAGTGVQCDLWRLLAAGQLALPAGVALLAINGLNPWGYAWNRRCDGEGIDVNRNFVDFNQPLPANPGYDELREAFFVDDPAESAQRLKAFRSTYGQTAYEIAVSGGQFTDPLGPFYGGNGNSHSRRVIETLMADYSLQQRRLAVIDVHTGLGPYGHGEIICDHPATSPGALAAKHWYGPSCTLPEQGESSSVPKLGLLDYAWHRIMGDDSCFVTLEFGTLGTDSLFNILLEENRGWARRGTAVMPTETMSEQERLTLAARMAAHFFPADSLWRETVLFRARQVITQAFNALGEV